jgi:23S rRNA (guanosine2251-2'-O)-methyltransferase
MKEQQLFGIRPVMEAVEAGKPVDKVFLKKGLEGDNARELMDLLRKHKIPYLFVPPEKLNRITRKNHQGVIAMMTPVETASLEALIPELFEKGEVPLLVVLDGVTDVRNFGAIARSAECLGAHALVIPYRGSAPLSADAIKTSAGALMRIPVCKVENLSRALSFIAESGIRLIGFSEKGSKTIAASDLSGPTALVMGSEEDGIARENSKLLHEMVRIPMSGSTASLNVSVSAGIGLYEAFRQREQ